MTAIHIDVDGDELTGREGQTIAAMLLSNGRTSWRSSRTGRPRGVFCGIGACFDCLVTVNGLRDVRACQRRAADGDLIELQRDSDQAARHKTAAQHESGAEQGSSAQASAGHEPSAPTSDEKAATRD